jgi:hypothetical protein
MDTFGALALASEHPHPTIMGSGPFNPKDNIITLEMWRQIIYIALFQVFVMFMILVTGPLSFDLDVKFLDARMKDSEFTDKGKLFTVMFYTFILMQVFNEINCRDIDQMSSKVFFKFFKNKYFLLIIGGTFGFLILINNFLNKLAQVAHLNQQEFLTCMVMASLVLVFSPLLKKLTGRKTLKKFDGIINENVDAESSFWVKILKPSPKPTAVVQPQEDENSAMSSKKEQLNEELLDQKDDQVEGEYNKNGTFEPARIETLDGSADKYNIMTEGPAPGEVVPMAIYTSPEREPMSPILGTIETDRKKEPSEHSSEHLSEEADKVGEPGQDVPKPVFTNHSSEPLSKIEEPIYEAHPS